MIKSIIGEVISQIKLLYVNITIQIQLRDVTVAKFMFRQYLSCAAPLFKTIIPKCKKYKHSVLYNGAVKWNSLPVKIRNIAFYNSFKSLQKKKKC